MEGPLLSPTAAGVTRATRNWGVIRSGETFEALATTLLFFEDSRAKLFGRPGPDGGQDARSGDGRTVYQAKHHISPTAAKAIAQAKGEAKRIVEYQKVGHERHAQWLGVTQWVLVTNASFNPRDTQTWTDEIVPLFNKLGLSARYWEEATLDGYLDKHPEVDRAFFGNENRVFLSPPEAYLRVADDDPFTQRAELAPYVGRDSDLKALDDFLAGDKGYLLVHAAGGTGKTRFLLEAANRVAATGDWQVLWANVHTLEASSTWFDAVVPERPTLLCIDEPDDEHLVPRLQEQLGRRVGRARQWKIAIAVRSAKDPIVRALQHPKQKRWVAELLLKPLETSECVDMCCKLLETGKLAGANTRWRQDTARTLARRFDGYPIWLSLAVHLLEEEGSLAKLPETTCDLCRQYLEEALKAQESGDRLLELLRWVALLGPVNREDDVLLDQLTDRAGFSEVPSVREALKRLATVRLLRSWGARDRLVDVKPDVFRDFIVREWFCEERGYGEHRYVPSEAAQELAEELSKSLCDGTAGKREERVLAALARTDFLLRYGNAPVNLGEPVFAALKAALSSMTPSQRISLIKRLADVGPYYPEETLQLLQRLRLEPAADETLSGRGWSRMLSQNDVLLELSYAHQLVARGDLSDAQAAFVLEELHALVLEEQRIAPALKYGLPNDGKRARTVIHNLLENGPSYCREFGDAAAQIVLRELDPQSLSRLGAQQLKALHAITEPLCTVARHQMWSDGPSTLRLNQQILYPGHSNVEGRQQVLERVRFVLEHEFDVVNDEVRAGLWNVLSVAHQQANYATGWVTDEHDPFVVEIGEWLLQDLTWAKTLLARRQASPRELRSARSLWRRHAEFDQKEDLTVLARELEGSYFSVPTVSMFESLTDWDRGEDTQRAVVRKAEELAAASTEDINEFVSIAEEFLGDHVQGVLSVASALGTFASSRESVRAFIIEGLQSLPHHSPAYQFTRECARSWISSHRRRDSGQSAQLVTELLGYCNPVKKLDLLKVLYGDRYVRDEHLLGSHAECELIRLQKPLFVELNGFRDFVACTLWGLRHDWEGLKAGIDDLLSSATREQRADTMHEVIDRVYQATEATSSPILPPDLLRWLWKQLVVTADLHCIEYEMRWHVEQILKALGKAPIQWLVDGVRDRALLCEAGGVLDWDPPSKLLPLVSLIARDNVATPEVQDAVTSLVAMLTVSPLMKHWLPKLLARVDPEGLEVPRHLAQLIEAAGGDRAAVENLSQAACYYGVGTPPWRHIARAAFNASRQCSKEEREYLYYIVSETGRRTWHARAGEVAKTFIDAAEAARSGLAAEDERNFVPFWEWRVRNAERELRNEQEKLKEEVWD